MGARLKKDTVQAGDAVLEGMVTQMAKGTQQAARAIDKALTLVASNQRVAQMRGTMKGMDTNFDREDDRL